MRGRKGEIGENMGSLRRANGMGSTATAILLCMKERQIDSRVPL